MSDASLFVGEEEGMLSDSCLVGVSSARLLILIGLLSLSSFKMRESNWSLGSQCPLRSLVSRRPRRFRR